MKKVMCLVMVGILCCVTVFSQAAGKKQFQIAAIFQTSIEEPWDGAIHQACQKVAKELNLKYEYSEGVAAADFEKVVREYSERGFDFIVGDAFLAGEEPSRRAAKDYPKIAYAFGSEFSPQAPNYSVFDNWIHEPAYLSGVIAGMMTKTNTLGIVAAIPIPEVNRLANAFKKGALSVNPRVKVKITYIGSWFDPPKAKEAAVAMIEGGADYLFAERFGVFEAAKEAKVFAFGNMADQNSLAPDVVVTSCVWDMYPLIRKSVDAIRNGSWSAKNLKDWSMMAAKGSYLASYHGFDAKLPVKVKTAVSDLTKKIMNGSFTVPVIETELVSD
ncbi:MAG: BMP family protein [Spirochaetes bacterium]|nr:BMP family protein [Spirochaetota bacterium]